MSQSKDLIDIAELRSLGGNDAHRIVDCRHDLFDPRKGRSDYLAGHIPGAVHADMDKDLAGPVEPDTGRHPLPDPAVFRQALQSWGIGDDTHVIAYDHGNGALAARLWWMLRFWLGHERVSVLDGGLRAWEADGGSLETSEPDYEAASFTRVTSDYVIATTGEIADAVAAGQSLNLVDARDAARFNGESEPIDSKAGHIPGAHNMPLGGNLDDSGQWRDMAELRQIWADFAAEAGAGPAVAMCGSGVTACHLILAATLAGVPPPRLYVGSWSEWIRDPERPVATAK